MKTVEEYLNKYSTFSKEHDGPVIPLSVAMIAVQLALTNQLRFEKPSWIKGEWNIRLKD